MTQKLLLSILLSITTTLCISWVQVSCGRAIFSLFTTWLSIGSPHELVTFKTVIVKDLLINIAIITAIYVILLGRIHTIRKNYLIIALCLATASIVHLSLLTFFHSNYNWTNKHTYSYISPNHNNTEPHKSSVSLLFYYPTFDKDQCMSYS